MAHQERFVDNGGVKIRYLDNAPARARGLPVVLVPGIVDCADDYGEALECFGDRRLLVVEMRGRGGSDAPPSGYSASEQAGDVEAVIDANGVGQFHLMTFSRGTTPALSVAFNRSTSVVTISIGDYLPAEIKLTTDIVDRMWATTWRGLPVPSRVRRHVLDGIRDAARGRELWEELAGMDRPVLVARGSEGGIVSDEAEARYRRSIPGLEVITIPGSAHDIFRPSRTAYPNAVLDFIRRRTPGS